MVGVLHSGRHGATAQLALSRTRQQAPMCLGAHAPAHFACLVSPGPSLTSCAQAPTEILAEQHFRSLQRLVQDMTREAGRRGETGFRQPRITLVGAGGHDKGGRTRASQWMAGNTWQVTVCLAGRAFLATNASSRLLSTITPAGDWLGDGQGAAADQRAAGEWGDVRGQEGGRRGRGRGLAVLGAALHYWVSRLLLGCSLASWLSQLPANTRRTASLHWLRLPLPPPAAQRHCCGHPRPDQRLHAVQAAGAGGGGRAAQVRVVDHG